MIVILMIEKDFLLLPYSFVVPKVCFISLLSVKMPEIKREYNRTDFVVCLSLP